LHSLNQAAKVYVVSLGCPKNLVDTEIMLGRLAQQGWEVTDAPEDAALLLVNTCGFIEPACQEAVDTILALAASKKSEAGQRLAVAGCLVQRYGHDLAAQLPEVDYFIGVNDFPRLPEILAIPPEAGQGRIWHEAPPYVFGEVQPRFAATPPHLAYLKIAEGCSHRCTFCLIPRIRGPYRSRPLPALLEEARRLAAQGVKELLLVAQDTTAYGRDWGGRPNLADLLAQLAQIPGFAWIRLLYAHPAHVTPGLLRTMAAHPRICPYLDLPIQHGHDVMLRRMGRGYRRQRILAVCQSIRQALPQATLRTTVMVGFPGETEEHFEALVALVQEVRFDHLGVFVYSPEAGAPALRLGPPPPRRVARRRARALMALQAKMVKARLKALVGAVQPVMLDGLSAESDYLLSGRLISQAPDIDGQVYLTDGIGRPGEILPAKITRALAYDLVGRLLNGASPDLPQGAPE
jgi:ribosomal protein S12 methylthiotransferase